jgi:hypothetical protein
MLPMGMLESVDGMAVQTKKDGGYGYILFTPEDSLAEALKNMDVQVIIEYEDGFMKVGMGEAYTIRMLIDEFWSLTHQTWEFGPTLPIRRNIDGTVVHGITWEWKELRALIEKDKRIKHPPKIVEDRGRGTLIRNLRSQGKLLQYWAMTQEKMEVGIFLPEESRNVEYWMDLSLQLVPKAQPEDYSTFLKDLCIQKTREISNGVAQWLEDLGDGFRIEARYLFNSVRVCFCPTGAFGDRIKRPMAEDPSPKDKWYSATGLMAYTYPLTEEVHEEPRILFGRDSYLQERYDDGEVQGGKIALIAFKQMRAQKPPNGLDRM